MPISLPAGLAACGTLPGRRKHRNHGRLCLPVRALPPPTGGKSPSPPHAASHPVRQPLECGDEVAALHRSGAERGVRAFPRPYTDLSSLRSAWGRQGGRSASAHRRGAAGGLVPTQSVGTRRKKTDLLPRCPFVVPPSGGRPSPIPLPPFPCPTPRPAERTNDRGMGDRGIKPERRSRRPVPCGSLWSAATKSPLCIRAERNGKPERPAISTPAEDRRADEFVVPPSGGLASSIPLPTFPCPSSCPAERRNDRGMGDRGMKPESKAGDSTADHADGRGYPREWLELSAPTELASVERGIGHYPATPPPPFPSPPARRRTGRGRGGSLPVKAKKGPRPRWLRGYG